MFKLQLKGISKIYKIHKNEDFYALRNINLSFRGNGFISIVGKSGSGKSTLLNLIAKLDTPSSGEILLNNININNKKNRKKFYINKIGILFQNYNLLEEHDVLYNVMLPALIDGKPKKEALEKGKKLLSYVGISEEKYKINCSKLSGGEKQRVALARCLINEPDILLCDEPTGALDSKSSEIVVKLLKEISKTRLVIFISHNLRITNKYSDRIITLQNGRVIDDLVISEVKGKQLEKNKRTKRYSSWKEKLSIINFKKRFYRNILSALGFSVGLASLFLVFGFINGKNTTLNKESSKMFDYGVGTLAIESKISSGSLLTITKSIRPNINDLYQESDLIKNYEICLNFDDVFPQNSNIQCRDNKLDDCFLSPIFDFENDYVNRSMIIKGRMPKSGNLDEVIINEKCYKYIYSVTKKDPLNDLLIINNEKEVNYVDFDDTTISDYCLIHNNTKIVGVVKELNYLSTNKIYYSYTGLQSLLQNTLVEKLSTYMNKEISWYERIEEADNSSSLSSYSLRLFPKKAQELINFENIKIINKNLSFTSQSLLIKKSLDEFIDVAEFGLEIFLIITLVGVVLILGIVSFSNYSDDHKTSAILTCIGASNNQISDVYVVESLISSFIGLLLSIPISLLIQKLANNIINKSIDINGLIQIPFSSYNNIALLLPILALLVTVFITLLATLLPIAFSKKIQLKEELQSL